MKNIFKYTALAVLMMGFVTSCDEGFDELNTDPVRLTNIDPTFQLNRAIISAAPDYGNFTYETTIVRQMITPFLGVGTGGNANQDNRSATNNNWNDGYNTSIKNLVDAAANLEGTTDQINLLSMIRIWKAYEFMVLTDTYGDIPYSQAGKGFLDGTAFPEYDAQEAIYDDILNELEEASAALSTSNDAVPQELMYASVGDNITRWKRLGYSLLLRAAMRLSKVNPTKAQSFVATAVAGGLMQSNDDNALVPHDANFRNPLGTNLNGGQAGFYYVDKEFVDWMQANNDPRLSVIATRYVGAATNGDQVPGTGSSDPADQIGMPQGFDNTTIPPQVTADGLASLYDYSELDRLRLGSPQAPSFLVTYSQTMLLFAEAIVRGWATGDENAAYAAGIRAHMEQLSMYPGETDVAESDITDYLAAHTLAGTQAQQIELINEQYWMSSYLNGHEAWANFRRSGYPNVAPNPYPGSELVSENFIRRLTYPDSEKTVNDPNLQVAIGRQGPDILDTRVWWDTP